MAVMVPIFSAHLLELSILNSSLSMLCCSNASPRFSRNMRIGAWELAKNAVLEAGAFGKRNTSHISSLPSVNRRCW